MTHLLVSIVSFQTGFLLGGSGSGSGSGAATSQGLANLANLACLQGKASYDSSRSSSNKKTNSKEGADILEGVVVGEQDKYGDRLLGPLFPPSMKSLVVGAASVNRTEFASLVEIGVPLDPSTSENDQVLILYNSVGSLPSTGTTTTGSASMTTQMVVPYENTQDALENCKALKVMLVQPSRVRSKRPDCVALMGQWESYHVHLFRRIPPEGSKNMKPSNEYPLRYVNRHVGDKGVEAQGMGIPNSRLTNGYWEMLVDYLNKKEATLERLKPVAHAVAYSGSGGKRRRKKEAIIVMLVNWGQSGMFLNFVCAARSRGLDLSNILMFATDQASVDLVSSLGIHVFDVQDAFGQMPEEAARVYGDLTFKRMMLAKVYCVHLLMELGYDVLFQDVDIVWHRNPLDFFHSSKAVAGYDMIFQDDGARSSRYAPYSPNSGFYFVRYNPRTLYFFNVFVRMGDLVLKYKSHQAVMTSIMNEHASWKGLRVKVLDKDSQEGLLFPGGHHFHRSKDFMKSFINGTTQINLFHMSWTENKDNKRLFFQQLGEWFVKRECEGKKPDDLAIVGKGEGDFTKVCCSSEPLIQCHYRDKPSKINCGKAPPIDKGKPSFW